MAASRQAVGRATRWLPFELLVALRFLREGRMQSVLILAGVTGGVAVIIFLTQLINQLQSSIIDRVLGSQAHIVVRPAEELTQRVPPATADGVAPAATTAVVQPRAQRLRPVDQWVQVAALAADTPGVLAVSPLVTGPAFAARGTANKSVVLMGVDPEAYRRIVKMDGYMTQGRFDVLGTSTLIGTELAQDLGLAVGDKLRVTTATGRSETLHIGGLFDTGNRDLNRRWVFVTLTLAQTLLDVPGGVSQIDLTVTDLFGADSVAKALSARTGLTVESWMQTNAGLLTALHRQPALLLQIDEFGMFMSAAADRKRSPRHITEILDNMTELYTSAGGIFLGAEYANRDGTNERRDINQPCLCVYGTTTPLHFWGALQGANVVDGSLARFLILPSDEDYPDENIAVGIRQAPSALIQGLQLIAAGGGVRKGNLTGKTADQNTAVNPMIVPMTEEARARFRQLSIELTEELRAAAGTAFTAILARIGENALKLALIVAVGRDPIRPEIEITAAEWAISFVRHYAQRTMEAVERHVADTETEAHLKRLKEIIRASGAKGITKSEITRASQWLKSRDRDEILLTLIESGDITTGMRGSSTKQAMVYRMARWDG
jgi:hypothetical protein